MQNTRLLSVSKLIEAHPGLTKGGVRWLVHRADANGLAGAGAIIRLGRRVLIDESKFLDWARSGTPARGEGGRRRQ